MVSQSRMMSIAERCKEIQRNYPQRPPREDEIKYEEIDQKAVYIDDEGNIERKEKMEVAIFFNMVFDKKTNLQIGFHLVDGNDERIIMYKGEHRYE